MKELDFELGREAMMSICPEDGCGLTRKKQGEFKATHWRLSNFWKRMLSSDRLCLWRKNAEKDQMTRNRRICEEHAPINKKMARMSGFNLFGT